MNGSNCPGPSPPVELAPADRPLLDLIHPPHGVYSVVYMAIRTQIYLTDEQRARLSERAKATGRPVSELVRDAIDVMLSADDDLDATFGSAPGIGSKVPSRSEWERRGPTAR